MQSKVKKFPSNQKLNLFFCRDGKQPIWLFLFGLCNVTYVKRRMHLDFAGNYRHNCATHYIKHHNLLRVTLISSNEYFSPKSNKRIAFVQFKRKMPKFQKRYRA